MNDNGYIKGGGLISPCRKFFYLKIPKNASTFINNLLIDNQWEEWNLIEDPIKIQNAIVFLRDPLERWISGFATYAALHLFGYGYGSDHFIEDYNLLTQKIIFDQVIFDDHTDFQVQYVNEIGHLNPIFFKCNNAIVEQLNSFLGIQLVVKHNIIDNKSDQNYDTKQVSAYIKNIINNNLDLKSKIIYYYQKDYNFIRQTEFYNEPR